MQTLVRLQLYIQTCWSTRLSSRKHPPADLTWNCFVLGVKSSLNPVDIEQNTYVLYETIYIYIDLIIQLPYHTQPYSYHTVLLSSETSSGDSASLVFTHGAGTSSLRSGSWGAESCSGFFGTDLNADRFA